MGDKKPAPQYNKNNSKAKEIVDEAAEESEDEYAGLGAASSTISFALLLFLLYCGAGFFFRALSFFMTSNC
jgi:hypothetical protein